jgi:hypothetical protein
MAKKPTPKVIQLPIFRFHCEDPEQFLLETYQMDGSDFRLAAGVKGGGNPEYVVRGQFPPAEKIACRVNAIREGRRSQGYPAATGGSLRRQAHRARPVPRRHEAETD